MVRFEGMAYLIITGGSIVAQSYNHTRKSGFMVDAYTKVVGNIFDYNNNRNDSVKIYDTVFVHRSDMAKSIHIEETASRGETIGISIPRGTAVKHGDILYNEKADRYIAVKQMPEKVIVAEIQSDRSKYDNDMAEIFLLLGHITGNRHRPISIKKGDSGSVSFPIQDDSELETFTVLFEQIPYVVKLKIASEIFVPHGGADVHGHQ